MNYERLLIGTLLVHPDVAGEAEGAMPSDFTGPHQLVWAEMIGLYRDGTLGLRSLIERLRRSGALTGLGFDDLEVTGEAYLQSLVSSFRGDPGEVPEYTEQVIAASVRRQLFSVLAIVRSEAQDDRMPIDEVLDSAEKRVMALRREKGGDAVSMADLATVLSNRISGLMNGTIMPAWTPSIERIRSIVHYAEDDDYIVVASRPGYGKSSLLRKELHEFARQSPALLINLENSQIEIVRSLISMRTGISNTKLKVPTMMTEAERQIVANDLEELARMPFYIHSVGSPTAQDLERISRKYIHKYNVKLIGVDYVQLTRNPGRDTRANDVSITSGTLRGVALNFGVPVIAAAQMNREIEHRGDSAEPQLSDLKESGSLEQDATIVIFPWPVWRNPTELDLRRFDQNNTVNGIREIAVPVKFYIRKNRNGGVGTSGLVLWDKSRNQFTPLNDWIPFT